MGQQTTEDQGAKRQFERQNTCEGGIIGTEVPSQGSTVPVKRQLIHTLGPWNSSGMGDTGSSADSNGAANRMAARSGLEPSFLTLAVLTREAGEFFAWGLSCIVGALATSLVSTHQMPVAPPLQSRDNQKSLQTSPNTLLGAKFSPVENH